MPDASFEEDLGKKCQISQEPQKSSKPVKTSQSSQTGPTEMPQPPERVQDRYQPSQQTPVKCRQRAPASTFGSWKVRHAARVPLSVQQERPGGTEVGRSVEAALGRLLADSGRADRSTQVTQGTGRIQSSAGPVRTPRRSSTGRGVTPPRQTTAAPRQTTPASRLSGQQTGPPRTRPAETGGRSETQGAGERRRTISGGDGSHSRAKTEASSGQRQTHHINGSGRTTMKPEDRRGDQSNNRNSAGYRDTQTGNTKSSRAKHSSKTERVQNSRLIISHKLNASSPHFQTEMKWNETESSRHRRGKTPNGKSWISALLFCGCINLTFYHACTHPFNSEQLLKYFQLICISSFTCCLYLSASRE